MCGLKKKLVEDRKRSKKNNWSQPGCSQKKNNWPRPVQYNKTVNFSTIQI